MNGVENDITSVYSESTIYDSDIVAREIEDFERNQRLRQYGLLTDIQEERYIDLIESIRNGDNSERTRLDRDFDQNQEEEISTSCGKIPLKKFVSLSKSRKFLIFFITGTVLTTAISLGVFWFPKYKNKLSNSDLPTTTENSKITTKPQIHLATTSPRTTEASSGTRKTILNLNECITTNDKIYSNRDCFYLTLQEDGNLVIRRIKDKWIVWSSVTTGSNSVSACLEKDGNFVVKDKNNSQQWSTKTSGKGVKYLMLSNQGLMVLKREDKTVLWHVAYSPVLAKYFC